MELTLLHSHLMVLGLVVSFAQVVRMFLEDCYQTVPVSNLILDGVDMVTQIKLKYELLATKLFSLYQKYHVLWLDGD